MAKKKEPKNPVLDTDTQAIRLARTLTRRARHGALATLDPATGGPLATRVAVATDLDGTPIVLVSSLSAHTDALIADPRCSLLVGEPGKGDPLAHARISLFCTAERLERDTPAGRQAERRYLNRHPKARLYAGFADFAFFRLNLDAANLNGGFARAYRLRRQELLSDQAVAAELADSEQRAVDHMNSDHADAVDAYAHHFAGARMRKWTLTGIDPDGLDLAHGDSIERVFFAEPLVRAEQLRPLLVEMANEARQAG